MNFCQEPYLSKIKELFNSQMGIPNDILDASYKEFFSRYNLGKKEDKLIKMPVSQVKLDQNVISNKTSYGIDLPIWIESGKKMNIALMAMDPMRRHIPGNTEFADFNSPFSIHKKEKNEYYPFIESLASLSNLYVTDIFKLYYKGALTKDKASNALKAFTELPIHANLMKAEFKIFKPDLILCMGNKAKDGLIKTDSSIKFEGYISGKLQEYRWRGIKTFFIPHLSKSAQGSRKDFIHANSDKEYSYSTYSRDVIEIILNKLN